MKDWVDSAAVYVRRLFENELPSHFLYHNLQHTERVLEKVRFLAEKENLSQEEKNLLELTAWFHDTGYTESSEQHEEKSKEIARKFLESKHVPQTVIQGVEQLIEITKCNTQPKSKLEEIICDADSSHLGSRHYFEISEELKKESSFHQGEDIDKLDWQKQNLDFFNNHQFYTETAKEKWQPMKEINLFELKKKVEKLDKKAQDKDKDKDTSKKLGRGVETLFRVQLKNHIELSAIADTKANILLSVNAIIISVLLSTLMPKLDSVSNSFLVIPTFILIAFSVITVVLSVLSTRPNISNVKVTREMVKNKQTNILFFGNFYKMSLEDFEWGIDYLIENDDVLYNSLTKDLYYLGLVLERKYRLLRITYTVFMFGIVISALAFVVSYFLTVSPHP